MYMKIEISVRVSESIPQETQFCMSVMLASAQEMGAGGPLEASTNYIGKQEIRSNEGKKESIVCAYRLYTDKRGFRPHQRCLEVVHLRVPRVLRQGHSCWLVKKDLVSLQTGFTQSGQLRGNCVEHSLFDWMCECTKSAKACKTEDRAT